MPLDKDMTKLMLFKFRLPASTDASKMEAPESGPLEKRNKTTSATTQTAKAHKATALMTDSKNEKKSLEE